MANIERIFDTLHVVNRVHIVKHENMLYGLLILFDPYRCALSRALMEKELEILFLHAI